METKKEKLTQKIVGWSLLGLLFVVVGGMVISHTNELTLNTFGEKVSDYSITLDSSNKVTSAGDVKQKTALGNDVTFTYSGVANSTSGHVTFTNGGKLVNKDHIRSIESITCNTSGSGTLSFKISYDGSTWGGSTTITSGYKYELGSNPYFVEFTASNTITINSLNIGFSCTINPNAHEGEETVERLLGVIDFWGLSNTTETGGSVLSEEQLLSRVYPSLDDKTTNVDLFDSVNISTVYTRYGAIGFGSGSNYGSLSLTLSEYTVNKVTIVAARRDSGKALYVNEVQKNVEAAFNSSMTSVTESNTSTLTWELDEATDEIEIENNSGNRIAVFRIFLYGLSGPIYVKPEESEIGFTATDSKANLYKTTDIFDTANGLSVVANYTGGATTAISKGGENGYSYVVKNSNDEVIDTSVAFGGLASSNYTLIVSYKNYIPQEINLSVSFIKVLTSITSFSVSMPALNTASKLSDVDLSGLSAVLNYNDNTNKLVSYSEFASNNLELLLLTPSGVTYDKNTAFGAAGEWKLKVRSTINNSVFAEFTFNVSAIPVATITVSGEAATLEEGKTMQLSINVTPNNATNKEVTWSSSSESIATVDNAGLVTAVSEGLVRITATAKDGSLTYGYLDLTVTAKVTGQDEGLFVLNTSGAPEVGSYVVFASTGSGNSGYAMSSTQSSNNRTGVAVSISDGTITRDSSSDFRAFLVREGNSTNTIAFYDEEAEGYLYAASSSSNQLKTESTLTNNSSWVVSGSESKTIAAQGNNSRNLLKWNTSAKVFSCYSSGQAAPYIYEKAGDPVYATSIKISGTTSIGVGETSLLSVAFTPNDTSVKAVTWESSNDLVAGVSSEGIVTGIKAGTATITATVLGENNTQITDSVTVTISNIPVSSVSLNKTTTSITKGSTETLIATISPSNATNKEVTWSTSDNSVAIVDEGTVTAIDAGTATITVTSVDGSKTATCTVTVTSSGSSMSSGVDVLTYDNIGISGTTYTSWSGLDAGSSNAIYAGHSAGGNNSIQLRMNDNSSGIVTTTSGGRIDSIVIDWNSNTSGRSVEIYGKNSAYSSPDDLYGSSSGTLLGSISDEETTLNVTGDYAYVGIRSHSGALYIDSITFNWGETEPVDPTGITINPTSVELGAGASRTLEVGYTPSNANQNKAITWSSNKTSVATVDSSGKVTVASNASAGQSATITAKLTNLPTITSTCTVTVVETPKADYTILLYICGADLESGSERFATSDIQEILSVSGQTSDTNIVIETGGAKSWASTYGISSSSLQRHHVSNKKLVTDTSLSYVSMGLSTTLQSFIEYGIENYPANRYGLILWNHGGAMQGVCYDEKKNDDSLLDYEVTDAVSSALSNKGMSGQKLEWIGYDACLMQVQDIGEKNSQYFNYMVASEESEAGYGWDYDTWLDDLYAKKSTPTILKAIVDGFISDTNALYSQYNWGASDQTLSYLDLSYAAAYKTAWENMAFQLKSKITDNNKTSFNNLVKTAKHYADTSYTTYGVFDAKDFVNKLAANSTFKPGSTYTDAVLTAHGNFVAYSAKGSGAGNSYGVTMFWAVSSSCYKGYYYTASCTNFTNWRYLVSTYGN